MQRRTFLKWSLGTGALAALGMVGWGCSRSDRGAAPPFRLPDLPYARTALEPHISAETLRFHYGQHHRGYVERANRLVEGTAHAKRSLLETMRKSHTPEGRAQSPLFNNAAQVFNHTFYWNSMTPEGGGPPQGLMAEWIDKSFGSYPAFRNAFSEAALSQFGSGWIWLVLAEGRLAVQATDNAETPILQGHQPLLVLDVWEHAYYLDYQHRRDRYVDAFLDHLIHWEFAANNLGET